MKDYRHGVSFVISFCGSSVRLRIMMFVRENLKFLHKHYYKLKKEETEVHLHPMVEHEMKYSIALVKDDECDVLPK